MRSKDAHARRRVEVAHSSALQERSAVTILRLRQDKLHRLTCPERKKIVQCRRGTPAKITEKCLTLSGSSAYRAEDGRDDDRGRDRSPLRSEERRENTGYSQTDSKKQKLAFGFGKKPAQPESKKGIQIKLGSTSKPNAKPAASFQKPTVASVFNADDDDDEPEEMPAEARMRMRNIGRETPTSAGPNSFGKTKQGFCDSKKIFEKTLKKAMEEANK